MKPQTIMIVEDDPILRDLTTRQLKALGFHSLPVSTGEEAVERSKNMDLVMILMDIGLPGIDGSHATLIIRENELNARRKRTPIVALTAHSDRQRCILAGMDDFIQKPALLNDIKRVTDKWILQAS